jgi:biotin carboxyl carrier protein
MLCSHCGATLRHTARVCIHCGTAVPSPDEAASPAVAPEPAAAPPQPPEPAPIETVAATTPATPVYEAAPAADTTPPPEAAPNATLHTLTLFDFGDATEAVVCELMVQVGDTVAVDQAVLCVETDEFIFEVPSDCNGEVRALLVKVGDTVRRDQPLAQIWGVGKTSDHAPPILASAPAAPAHVPVAASSPSAEPAAATSSSWGWWLVGAALAVAGYLLAQALGTPSLSSDTTSAPSQRVAQLQAPPPISSSGNASAVVLNTDDLNAMLRMAAVDDWAGVQTLLRDKRPQTHLVKDKTAARTYNQAGLDLINQGDWVSAHGMFDMGVQANANDAEIRNNLGFAELRLGRHDSAQQNLVSALLMAPTRTNAWSNLAELMADTNETNTAAASLRLAVHFSRNQKRTLEFLGDPARVPSAALRGVIESHWAAIAAVPPYARP